MLIRILVAVVAIPILLLVIFVAPVWVLGIVVGLISACCAWELLHCVRADAKLRFLIYAAVCAFCIPFVSMFVDAGAVYATALFVLLAVMLIELMLTFRAETPMDLGVVTAALLSGGVIPIMLSFILRLALRENGSVFALLPFAAAFASDSGAYFEGVFNGKHKLAPRLSPNKTVEGSIGGFLAAIAVLLIYGLVLKIAEFTVNFPVMTVYGFFGSLAAQLGDLSFSAVKRLCGIKDYGKILPGHGGMLDRFDSMVWVAPVLVLLVIWVPAISK